MLRGLKMMMNFYCSEKEDKTNRFDSEVGTRLRTNQNKTMAKPQNNAKHGEGHADDEEAPGGDQAAADEDQ